MLRHEKVSLPASNARQTQLIIASRQDSDLEAFSHNPTDGSFASFAHQRDT